ncbi:LysR family transcriptional regulator [Roseibium sp. SCP14]|uniref:LysR family transcriptional regulator n=1 Tax=Roseibium sp. SCP14 TaxID=3141375 RepID=UPI00333C0E08
MPPLEISLLRSFVAVMRLGSISAAALQVGRTQSALSTQMKRLEQIVGGEVFHRSGSGVSPTRLGERLMTHAQSILAVHDEALSDLTDKGLQGSVRLGCPEDYLNAFIPNILSRFSAEHPAVEIEIACAPTSELKSMLHRRQIDVALLSETMDTIPKEPLRRTRLVWIASKPRSQVFQGEVLPLALAAPNTLDHQIACEAMRRAEQPYRIAFAASSLTGLLAIARSGHAISVVTDTAVPEDLFIVNDPLPVLPEVGIYLECSVPQAGDVLEEFCRVTSEVVQSTRT